MWKIYFVTIDEVNRTTTGKEHKKTFSEFICGGKWTAEK